jgi:hypothetical protein
LHRSTISKVSKLIQTSKVESKLLHGEAMLQQFLLAGSAFADGAAGLHQFGMGQVVAPQRSRDSNSRCSAFMAMFQPSSDPMARRLSGFPGQVNHFVKIARTARNRRFPLRFGLARSLAYCTLSVGSATG